MVVTWLSFLSVAPCFPPPPRGEKVVASAHGAKVRAAHGGAVAGTGGRPR